MKKRIRTTLRISTGLSVIWAVCMFVLCLFSEKRLHRVKMQLQESVALLEEERNAYKDEKATIKELREVKLGLKSELRSLKKQVARKKGLSGDEPQEDDHSELKLAEERHTLMRENKALLRRISESRHVLSACRTSPCLEALDDDQRQELQNTHEAWRATVQALLNASSRGDADRVRKLQALVRKLADSADIATGNTQLYFNQAEKIIEASDDILDAVLTRKKLRTSTSTDEADVSDDPATILIP